MRKVVGYQRYGQMFRSQGSKVQDRLSETSYRITSVGDGGSQRGNMFCGLILKEFIIYSASDKKIV